MSSDTRVGFANKTGARIQANHINGYFINIVHINTQSLLSTVTDIEILVMERQIDILCISETWLSVELKDKFVNIAFIAITKDVEE